MVDETLDEPSRKGDIKRPEYIRPEWRPLLSTFRKPNQRVAIWQLINTVVPYAALIYLMIMSVRLGYSYILTLLLALPAAAFLLRIFILFHDCVHASFLKSKRANKILGTILGVMVFTAFEDWRYSHLRHHSHFANLDSRGVGDVWTMTLQEYKNSPRTTKLLYRIYRNLFVMVILGSAYLFLLSNRVPKLGGKWKERLSVLFTDLVIATIVLVAAWLIGWRTYILVQLPVLWMAWAAGIWMFYVQHQFPGGYWARGSDWKATQAAFKGSSFYNLPAVLAWFTGNIGFHHIHHLSPRIPNYRLKKCYKTIPELQTISPLTPLKSLACIRLKMWDEEQRKMVAFQKKK